MSKKTQLERIRGILKKVGRIDNFTAIRNRWTLRLGARIWELRDEGWEIRTERKPNKNTVYVLEKAA